MGAVDTLFGARLVGGVLALNIWPVGAAAPFGCHGVVGVICDGVVKGCAGSEPVFTGTPGPRIVAGFVG
jgi:hypothetical protein